MLTDIEALQDKNCDCENGEIHNNAQQFLQYADEAAVVLVLMYTCRALQTHMLVQVGAYKQMFAALYRQMLGLLYRNAYVPI